MRIKKKGIAIIIAVVIVGGALGLSKTRQSNYLPVQATKVSQGDLKSYLSITGVVKSKEMKEYYGSEVKVSKVYVKVGDKVKKGDVLITYEVEDLNTIVKQAEIEYNNAILQKQDLQKQNGEINNNINNKNAEVVDIEKRIEDINNKIRALQNSSDPSISSQVEGFEWQKSTLEQQKTILVKEKNTIYPISKEKLKQAENTVNLAKLTLDTAKKNLSKSVDRVVAENDGVVTNLNATEGAMANMAKPLIVVQNTENLKVVISVGKYDANNINLNQSAVIKNQKKQYEGKISYIAPAAEKSQDPTSGDTTLTVDIDIEDKNPDLKIDFDVDVDILLGEAREVKKVPTECIMTDKKSKNFIYTINNNKVVEREVKLGIESDNEAEIISSAAVGEEVILNPTDNIKNGTLVKVSSNIDSIKTKKLFFIK